MGIELTPEDRVTLALATAVQNHLCATCVVENSGLTPKWCPFLQEACACSPLAD